LLDAQETRIEKLTQMLSKDAASKEEMRTFFNGDDPKTAYYHKTAKA